MRLIRREDVQWRELPKLESPSVARFRVEGALNADGFGVAMIEGLDDVVSDSLAPHRQQWDHDTLAHLLEKVERAEVLLVHDSGSDPLVPAMRKGKHDDWAPEASVSPMARANLEGIVAYAALTKGILRPRRDPCTKKPEKQKEEPKKDEVTLSNIRWEHKSEAAKEKRPSVARLDDAVFLMVDVDTVSNGTKVEFQIYENGKLQATVKGSVDDIDGPAVGRSTRAWKVEDFRDLEEERELALTFVAVVKEVRSSEGKIPVPDVEPKLLLCDSAGVDAAPLIDTKWKILRYKKEIASGKSDDKGEVKLPQKLRYFTGSQRAKNGFDDYVIRFAGRQMKLTALHQDQLIPNDKSEGVQQRLSVLSYNCGSEEKVGPYTTAAIKGYRVDKALGDGELDSTLASKLDEDIGLASA